MAFTVEHADTGDIHNVAQADPDDEYLCLDCGTEVALVAAVGLFAMWAATDELSRFGRDDAIFSLFYTHSTERSGFGTGVCISSSVPYPHTMRVFCA